MRRSACPHTTKQYYKTMLHVIQAEWFSTIVLYIVRIPARDESTVREENVISIHPSSLFLLLPSSVSSLRPVLLSHVPKVALVHSASAVDTQPAAHV